MADPQTTSRGPNCFMGGKVTPRIRRPAVTRTWRVSRRSLARKMTMAISASYEGWNFTGPTLMFR